MIIVIKIELVTQIQILNEVDYVSLYSNTLRKGMNASACLSYVLIVGQSRLFSPGKGNSQGGSIKQYYTACYSSYLP